MKWLLLLLVACGDNGVTPARVRDGFLHDDQGRAVIMRGVNLSGAQKIAPYLDDKTAADYARVRNDWGFNAIRFIMTWSAVEPQQGHYDELYLGAVRERMEWARDAGLFVIIEMHEDIYGEGFGFDGAPKWTCDPANYEGFVPGDPWFVSATDPKVEACVDHLMNDADIQDQFVAMWKHVAQTLSDEPAIIGFDPLNEPNWGTYPIFTFEKDKLAPLYDRVVGDVRGVTNWVAFLEPGASRNLGTATSLPTPSYPDVMYAPHSYDSAAESGAGFDESHRQSIIDNVAELQAEASARGEGLWIGEYGGVAANPGIIGYMTAQYDAAGAVAGSSMYWSYDKSDGYSLLDPEGNEKPDLVNTVVRPYPERVAGTPVSYAFADGVFTMVMRGDASIEAPTVISIPPRVWPNGFTVDCASCKAQAIVPGGVELIGADGTITIH